MLVQQVPYLLRLACILNVTGMWTDFSKKTLYSDVHYRMVILDAVCSLDTGAGYKRGSGEASV